MHFLSSYVKLLKSKLEDQIQNNSTLNSMELLDGFSSDLNINKVYLIRTEVMDLSGEFFEQDVVYRVIFDDIHFNVVFRDVYHAELDNEQDYYIRGKFYNTNLLSVEGV